MGEMGSNQVTKEDFVTHTFDPFKNETTSRLNLPISFVASGISFYMINIERYQSAGATDSDETFDTARLIVSCKTNEASHDVSLDRWSAIQLDEIVFNCDQENIVIEESWENIPETIDDYPNIDHNLYYSFNTCLFLLTEEQCKKIASAKALEIRVQSRYSNIDLTDDEENNLQDAVKLFYHEIYDKNSFTDEIEQIKETTLAKQQESEEFSAGGCFIATAVYQQEDHFNLIVLRSFRDNYLQKYLFGRNFIRIYYKYGPKIALIVAKNRYLKIIFKPLVDFLTLIVRKLKIG